MRAESEGKAKDVSRTRCVETVAMHDVALLSEGLLWIEKTACLTSWKIISMSPTVGSKRMLRFALMTDEGKTVPAGT